MPEKRISLIVAAAENNVIGKDNEMPWHLPEDFKYFKEKTTGKPCIMGRKTFESILGQLGKPLPNRPSLVVSGSGYAHEGATVFSSLDDAFDAAREYEAEEIMVIGGATIYHQALDMADRIYLTRVHMSPDGDAYFPELGDEWEEVSRDDRKKFSFLVFERR
jgi:dihydrofolate reductase